MSTPTERLLATALLVAPVLSLAADSTYAVRGWSDPTGAVLHVLGAVLYGLVVLRVAAWLPAASVLAAALVLTGVAGATGNVAYGFESIHLSLGDVALVDRSGAATVIKPLGLVFPFSLVLVAAALGRLGAPWRAGFVLMAALLWPIGHIGDAAPVAVASNLVLVVALGSLAWSEPATRRASRPLRSDALGPT